MPYQYLSNSPAETHLHLWPHRSLPKTGFVWFIGGTVALIAVPMLSILGTPVLWGVLPFAVIAVAGVWLALQRSYRDGQILEDLTVTPARVTLTRHGPRGRRQAWEANPHWVRVALHAEGGPVPNYVTLQGGPREVELGAFLSEAERLSLRDEVQAALARLR
jgi:uncharacterized membrane protein